jgi:uncharacterized damage-inducible protein DinB
MHQPQNENIRQPEECLAELDKSFGVFLTAASEYPRERVREKPSEKAFSATEIVYHMLDVERLWQQRIRGMLDHTMTHFQQMNPDKVAIEEHYNEKLYDAGISDLRLARKETHALVQGMKPREFELTGIHSKYGEMNMFNILETIENHDHTHAAQLHRTLMLVTQPNTPA